MSTRVQDWGALDLGADGDIAVRARVEDAGSAGLESSTAATLAAARTASPGRVAVADVKCMTVLGTPGIHGERCVTTSSVGGKRYSLRCTVLLL